MRILYLVPPGPHSRKFVRTFSRQHEVLAVTQFPGAEPGWVALGGGSRLGRWLTGPNARRLRRIADEFKPDLVHAFHLLPSATIAAAAGLRPLVVSAMGADVYSAGGQVSWRGELLHLTPFPRVWHRRISRAFDLALVECEDVKRRMAGLGYAGSKVKAVPWGPDCGEFAPAPRDEKLRERMAGRCETVVACTRSHRKVYGVEEVVRMMPLLPEKVGLVLCGSGPQTTHLRSLASRLGVEDRVKFMGEVPQESLPAILNCADVAISLAYSDTISVALLEAMACGVPVIARDVGGTREFLTHGSSAILLPDSSPEKTARELSALLLDGPRMRSMGSKAREEVIEKADWRKCAPVIDREYQVLAARQGSEAFV